MKQKGGNSLGNRMKTYENVSRHYLTKRTPVIIRVDGKAFHTLTKKMEKPFDDRFISCMHETALFLFKKIMNCKLAYVQSDEISLLLVDYATINTDAWYNNNIQKMASVSASLATFAFYKEFIKQFGVSDDNAFGAPEASDIDTSKAITCFDSRAFNIPIGEVCNYFIWRQQDATRNSIQGLARAHFSHNECDNLNSNQLQDELMLKKGINWNHIPTAYKRGSCIIKQSNCKPNIDNEIPIFTQNREYIEQFLNY